VNAQIQTKTTLMQELGDGEELASLTNPWRRQKPIIEKINEVLVT
jgi:hypothetical protein